MWLDMQTFSWSWDGSIFLKHLWFFFEIYLYFLLQYSYLPYSLSLFLYVNSRRKISAHFSCFFDNVEIRVLTITFFCHRVSWGCLCGLSFESLVSWGNFQKEGDSVFTNFGSELWVLHRKSQITNLSHISRSGVYAWSFPLGS